MDICDSEQDLSDNNSLHPGSSVTSVMAATESILCSDSRLPPRPVEPLPEDCCGQGCQPCIFDIYQQQLAHWERECRRLQTAECNTSVADVISPLQWSCFHCISVKREAVGVNIYTFEAVETKGSLKFHPGQYLIAQSNINCSITRAYTPLPGKTAGEFCVLVKLYERGLMSSFWKTVGPGKVVLWKGPYESGFRYVPNSHRHVVMFCGGTGLAPCYALAHHITSDELDETFIRIIFSCKTRDDILLRESLHRLRENWNFTSKTVLTQDDGVGLTKWYGEDIFSERITSDVVASELTGKSSVCVVICGTQSFNKDVCVYVRKYGVLEENINIL